MTCARQETWGRTSKHGRDLDISDGPKGAKSRRPRLPISPLSSRFEQKGYLLAGWSLDRDTRYLRAAHLRGLFARLRCQYPCGADPTSRVGSDLQAYQMFRPAGGRCPVRRKQCKTSRVCDTLRCTSQSSLAIEWEIVFCSRQWTLSSSNHTSESLLPQCHY